MTDKQYSDMGIPLTSGGADFKPLNEGTYDFVIHGIIGLGLRPNSYEGQPKDPVTKIKIIFELPDSIRDDGQTQVVGYKLNSGVAERGNYYKLLHMLLGERVNKDTIKEFVNSTGMKQLLGLVGSLDIRHWDNEGRIIAMVDGKSITKLHPKVAKPVATRPEFFFNPFVPDLKVFNDILTWHTKKEVMEALNADQFPEELHQAWVKAQENKNSQDANKKKEEAIDVSDVDTASIE